MLLKIYGYEYEYAKFSWILLYSPWGTQSSLNQIAWEHHEAANLIIKHLYSKQNLSLGYGYNDMSESFVDNTVDRKISQGYYYYIMIHESMSYLEEQLVGGQNKQDTVTIPSTETELLALSQTTKEAISGF